MFFFFNDTATTEIYTLSLHDALPIYSIVADGPPLVVKVPTGGQHATVTFNGTAGQRVRDRKSTRLNSSHSQISYAVFCLKKKKTIIHTFCVLRLFVVYKGATDSSNQS